MLKRTGLYPFLLVAFVVLNPLVDNLGLINPIQAFRPLVILLLATGLLLLLVCALTRNWLYAAYLTFLSLLAFFLYGHVNNLVLDKLPNEHAEIYPLIALGLWALVAVLLGRPKTWNRLGGSARITPGLNFVLSMAVLSQLLFAGFQWVQQRSYMIGHAATGEILPDTGETLKLDCSTSPDIYWIILDAYGRADVLQDLYGVDTYPFLDALREKGFYIADQSHTNYIQTVYSIPSALDLNYLAPMPAHESGYDYFPKLMANNRLMSLLEQCGYKTVAFKNGFVFTSYPAADLYYAFGSRLNEIEGLVLAGTPLDLLLEKLKLQPPERTYEAHRLRVQQTFNTLSALPEVDGPKFVYAHIISPHPPFVFDAQGNPLRPPRGYSMVDGDDFRGSWEEYQRGYAAQVQYVNQMVEKTVDDILSRSEKPPVIIIQGDHGPGGNLKWKSPGDSCYAERTSILNAYYLPEGADALLSPDITPVNSFRVVLNAYFGTNLELLPGNTYFTSPRPGGAFIDITSQRDSLENCR